MRYANSIHNHVFKYFYVVQTIFSRYAIFFQRFPSTKRAYAYTYISLNAKYLQFFIGLKISFIRKKHDLCNHIIFFRVKNNIMEI